MSKKNNLKHNPLFSKTDSDFPRQLLYWNHHFNKRQMPWKGEKDPYKIWLSEIILQQTRVEQGLKYYENFIAAFPSIAVLAAAPDEVVFKLWEGLGYYSRCRNLIATARLISATMNGRFPHTYEDILALKGVGAYTAAAIASFAFSLPYAVLDGNVYRVLSRIFSIDMPVDSPAGKKVFADLAQQLLPQNKAGEYNQAIMDFGAVVCKPVPLCSTCFFNIHCLAYLKGTQALYPVKGKKLTIKKRWLHYFIVQQGGEILIQLRTEKDIWQNLYQFVLIETVKPATIKSLLPELKKQFNIYPISITEPWRSEQKLTHQTISFQFSMIEIAGKFEVNNHRWVAIGQLQNLPFPRTLQLVVARHLQP